MLPRIGMECVKFSLIKRDLPETQAKVSHKAPSVNYFLLLLELFVRGERKTACYQLLKSIFCNQYSSVWDSEKSLLVILNGADSFWSQEDTHVIKRSVQVKSKHFKCKLSHLHFCVFRVFAEKWTQTYLIKPQWMRGTKEVLFPKK